VRTPTAASRQRLLISCGRRDDDRFETLFGKVALIGIGLIGSSLAHAMRRAGLAAHIAGYSHRSETIEKAQAIGFADSFHTSLAPAVRGADLVVLAAPVAHSENSLANSART